MESTEHHTQWVLVNLLLGIKRQSMRLKSHLHELILRLFNDVHSVLRLMCSTLLYAFMMYSSTGTTLVISFPQLVANVENNVGLMVSII